MVGCRLPVCERTPDPLLVGRDGRRRPCVLGPCASVSLSWLPWLLPRQRDAWAGPGGRFSPRKQATGPRPTHGGQRHQAPDPVYVVDERRGLLDGRTCHVPAVRGQVVVVPAGVAGDAFASAHGEPCARQDRHRSVQRLVRAEPVPQHRVAAQLGLSRSQDPLSASRSGAASRVVCTGRAACLRGSPRSGASNRAPAKHSAAHDRDAPTETFGGGGSGTGSPGA